MGVMNALALLELKPNMVAGASVGSITAAMVASALLEKDQQSTARKVAQLSAVYLGIDRIVLTDKFADFIRNWTIRASEARFSLRQADEVFRKYDAQSSRAFQRDVRQVVAGLERLFYINPYQLNELVRLARSRQFAKFRVQLKDRIQQWLDRMDVGEEVLGAEELRRPLLAARVERDLAHLLVQTGRTTEAHEIARTARVRFKALGAVAEVRALDRLLTD